MYIRARLTIWDNDFFAYWQANRENRELAMISCAPALRKLKVVVPELGRLGRFHTEAKAKMTIP
jgi:hypothetical protein